jgi:hypothetical protein
MPEVLERSVRRTRCNAAAHKEVFMPVKRILPLEKEEVWPEKFAREIPAYQFLMKALISFVLLGAAIYILVIEPFPSDASEKWAYGILGTLLGYWFNDHLPYRRPVFRDFPALRPPTRRAEPR